MILIITFPFYKLQSSSSNHRISSEYWACYSLKLWFCQSYFPPIQLTHHFFLTVWNESHASISVDVCLSSKSFFLEFTQFFKTQLDYLSHFPGRRWWYPQHHSPLSSSDHDRFLGVPYCILPIYHTSIIALTTVNCYCLGLIFTGKMNIKQKM